MVENKLFISRYSDSDTLCIKTQRLKTKKKAYLDWSTTGLLLGGAVFPGVRLVGSFCIGLTHNTELVFNLVVMQMQHLGINTTSRTLQTREMLPLSCLFYCRERGLFPSQVSVNLTLTTSAQPSNGCLVASVIDFAQFLENIASSFLRPSYRRNTPVKLGENRRVQPETARPSK